MQKDTDRLCSRIVPDDENETAFSITDICPTLLRLLEKKVGLPTGKIVAGTFGRSDIAFQTLYDIQGFEGYCGKSLEDVIEGRTGADLESFDRVVIYLIDGMGLPSFYKCGKEFFEKVKPELLMPMYTVFPSMTPVATTSLLTGAFPAAHGVVAPRFFDMESEEKYIVMPYLTENAILSLPRVLPITSHFLLSDLWKDNECSLGMISVGKSHAQNEGRRFLETFFKEEFVLGGHYSGVVDNKAAFEEAITFITKHASKRFYVLVVRFTIDHLAHRYGSRDDAVLQELGQVLNYIVQLNSKLQTLNQDKKHLCFLVSDHGHKDVPEGFVPFPQFKKYLGEEYSLYATNQTLLGLYHEGLHALTMKSKINPRLARIKKKGSEFYGYDTSSEKWKVLRPGKLEKFATIDITEEVYGVDQFLGNIVVHFENFYVGDGKGASYQDDYTNFKSSHGGLALEEVLIPGFLWKT